MPNSPLLYSPTMPCRRKRSAVLARTHRQLASSHIENSQTPMEPSPSSSSSSSTLELESSVAASISVSAASGELQPPCKRLKLVVPFVRSTSFFADRFLGSQTKLLQFSLGQTKLLLLFTNDWSATYPASSEQLYGKTRRRQLKTR